MSMINASNKINFLKNAKSLRKVTKTPTDNYYRQRLLMQYKNPYTEILFLTHIYKKKKWLKSK